MRARSIKQKCHVENMAINCVRQALQRYCYSLFLLLLWSSHVNVQTMKTQKKRRGAERTRTTTVIIIMINPLIFHEFSSFFFHTFTVNIIRMWHIAIARMRVATGAYCSIPHKHTSKAFCMHYNNNNNEHNSNVLT